MAWMMTVTRSFATGVQGLVSGVWATVATPLVYRPLRPVTKQAIKGSFWLAHGAQSLVELTQEEWNDIVAEARAEADGESPPRLEATSTAVTDGTPANGAPAEAASSPADLTDVKGVGESYARLLRAADVATIEQLAAREPEPLRTRLLDANKTHEVVRRVPSVGHIRGWIEDAAGRPE